MVVKNRIHGTGVYIFTYMKSWILMVNVGKYTSPMDVIKYGGNKNPRCRIQLWSPLSLWCVFSLADQSTCFNSPRGPEKGRQIPRKS